VVLDTVIAGNARLFEVMKEKDAIYAKEDFSDEDGIRASELEAEFAEMNGWEAESDAESLLNGLGIETEYHYKLMKELDGAQKVKVLLARALFGNPDILLLDEPTNHLDLDAIAWLEEFLINFENTVIVVSHDRYFLNKVCTYIADIDYGKIQLYAGNYDFWYESSQLMIRQMKEANKKKEEQIKELKEFIARFSANASKSKQATSRKKALEKIELDTIKPSSRKYPYIDFRPNREIGNEVLTVEGLTKTINGEKVLDNISFVIQREDKVAFVGGNELAKTTLFQILAGELEPDAGTYKWGVTTSQAYFPKDNTKEFDNDYTITEWLTGYSEVKDATYVRGFLGRMLFAGEDGVKKVKVLSGGEKVRCLLSKMMISGANCLIFDEPTNHLDMESISALNDGMIKFPGVELFACRDHQVVQTTANRIMEILPDGSLIDKRSTYDEYLENDEMARKRTVYNTVTEEEEDD
jgi:ATPase subunit of ABC transporter with duplicated ATPase domains